MFTKFIIALIIVVGALLSAALALASTGSAPVDAGTGTMPVLLLLGVALAVNYAAGTHTAEERGEEAYLIVAQLLMELEREQGWACSTGPQASVDETDWLAEQADVATQRYVEALRVGGDIASLRCEMDREVLAHANAVALDDRAATAAAENYIARQTVADLLSTGCSAEEAMARTKRMVVLWRRR